MPASPNYVNKGNGMKFGVWYGMAAWFLILKGLEIAPFAEWSWWFVVIPIIWPSLGEIDEFPSRKGKWFSAHARSFCKRKPDDASAPLNATRKQP